jgi:tetratricopeptide (TPR) repeat protein
MELAWVRGRGEEGLRRGMAYFAIEEARGNPAPPLVPVRDSAMVDIWHMEQPARAVQRMDAARSRPAVRSLSLDERRYFDYSILYSNAGRPDRARALLAELDRAPDADTAFRRRNAPLYHLALGDLAIAERRGMDAVREMRLADRLPDGPATSCLGCTLEPLARAFDAAGMTDSAIVAYARYVKVPSSFLFPDTYGLARAHNRLGELYEAKGDRARAAQHYAAFVDLWKNADPVLQPRVARARARLAALRTR